MDLGDGVFFVEKPPAAPGVPYDVLKQRLQQRLDRRGVEITEMIREEVLFPMNLPLPDPSQPVPAFGGAASMVHPARAMVGSLLRRSPDLAGTIVSLSKPWFNRIGATLASARPSNGAAPSALSVRFGAVDGLQRGAAAHHFATFFSLPREEWFGHFLYRCPA